MSKKILVVDDSETVRSHVGAALTDVGFEVVEAFDGVDGLEKLAAHPEIALVFCDVNMPRMNGIDMLTEAKRDGKNPALPIIMLTTEGHPELIGRAKKAGAKGWIVKPFKPEMVVMTAKKLTAAA